MLLVSCTLSTPKQEFTTPQVEEKVLTDDEEKQEVIDDEGKQTVEQSTKEEVTQESGGTHFDIKASIAGWLPDNADNVSRAIADLIPDDLAVVRNVAAKMIKTTIMTEFELKIEHIEPIDGDDRYSARVVIGFPISLELPILGKKEYLITVSYDFIIEEGQVIDANIDASSFSMNEVDTQTDDTNQAGEAIIMKITPLERVGSSYRYRTILEEKNGIEIYINSLTREFIETGYVWTGGRDYLLDHVGSFTIPAHGKLEWETSFDLSEVKSYFEEHEKVTYREGWYGTDAEGNPIGVVFSISTSEF